MKKALAALASVLIAFVPTYSKAVETNQEDKDHIILLSVVDALRIPINIDSPICKEYPTYYGAYHIGGEDFVLCSRGDRDVRLNTIRHEAWHVYQDIKDCSIKDMTALKPAMGIGAVPTAYKKLAAKVYQPSDVASEAEAQWGADTFSALTITNLILQKVDECKITLSE